MSANPLKDGGLAITIGGSPLTAKANELEYGSTRYGDAGAEFWLQVTDPMDPQADYPALLYS